MPLGTILSAPTTTGTTIIIIIVFIIIKLFIIEDLKKFLMVLKQNTT